MNKEFSPLSILEELIRIPSQNPMGHDHSGTEWLEKGMSDWLCNFFATHNVTHEYHEIESGRGNVIARLDGDPRRQTILLDAHQDTVPVAGMTIDPYSPVQHDGRIYGRGACDVKGPMSCILSTIARLAAEGNQDHANIIVSMTCDEERGQKGAKALAELIQTGSALIPKKPDAAIVSEPTDLNVVIAHKGTARWKIKTAGVAAHSSNPKLGKNAIYMMASILHAIEGYANGLSSTGINHVLCGAPTLSVGTIRGGQSVNIVPDECLIEIDRRVVPGESIDDVIPDLERFLSQEIDVPFEVLPPDTMTNPLSDTSNGKFATALHSMSGSVTGNCQKVGVAFTTHAPRIADIGIPTVVFGPGSIAQAHTKDEWIEINQLDQSAEILRRCVKDSE